MIVFSSYYFLLPYIVLFKIHFECFLCLFKHRFYFYAISLKRRERERERERRFRMHYLQKRPYLTSCSKEYVELSNSILTIIVVYILDIFGTWANSKSCLLLFFLYISP